MHSLKSFYTNTVLILIFISFIGVNLWMQFGIGGISDIKHVSGGKTIPDINLFQTVDNISETLNAYGAQGRVYYLRYQFRDFIYPLVYGLLLMGLIYRMIKPRSINFWVFLPWIAVGFDFIENYYLRVIVYDYPEIYSTKVAIASWATSLKWFFILSSLVVFFLAYMKRRRKNIAIEKKTVRYNAI